MDIPSTSGNIPFSVSYQSHRLKGCCLHSALSDDKFIKHDTHDVSIRVYVLVKTAKHELKQIQPQSRYRSTETVKIKAKRKGKVTMQVTRWASRERIRCTIRRIILTLSFSYPLIFISNFYCHLTPRLTYVWMIFLF
jgi:hypothetical protein